MVWLRAQSLFTVLGWSVYLHRVGPAKEKEGCGSGTVTISLLAFITPSESPTNTVYHTSLTWTDPPPYAQASLRHFFGLPLEVNFLSLTKSFFFLTKKSTVLNLFASTNSLFSWIRFLIGKTSKMCSGRCSRGLALGIIEPDILPKCPVCFYFSLKKGVVKL